MAGQTDGKSAVPTAAGIEEIRAIQDPLIRNLRITQAYSELSRAFRVQTGDAANWCTFATWASKQAGQSIRGQDLYRALKRRVQIPVRWAAPVESVYRSLLRRGLLNPHTRLGLFVKAVPGVLDILERTSEAVAEGNRKVFEEIGLEFARFLEVIPDGAPESDARMTEFIDSLRDGDPPEGQGLLKRAFAAYARAFSAPDGSRRAELVLLGNVLIGVHEQTRLQPQIKESMDAPIIEVRELGERVLGVVFPGSKAWWRLLHGPAVWLLGVLGWGLALFARKLARLVITDRLMTLQVPGRLLRLGHNLDAPVPAELTNPTDPGLIALTQRYATPPDDPDGCGAEDWAVLDERMRYILQLFLRFQEDAQLFDPPFTQEQVWQFQAGVLPDGKL